MTGGKKRRGNNREAGYQWAPTPLSRIMKARRKPAGVSDVRWRMELSRRRMRSRDGVVELALDPEKM